MAATAPPAASPARAGASLSSERARWADDEAARLYAEYRPKIHRFCLGQLRSREDAEDAVQNTFLRVHTALRRGVVPEFEGPWLYKIAHNVCLSRRLGATRRARVESPHDLGTLEEHTAAREPPRDELFGLDEALAAMPPRLRTALLLREWQGLSYAEIARAMNASHSAVETLIFRARKHLAKALETTVSRPTRRVAGALNLPALLTVLRGMIGGAGVAKLAVGTAALTVALTGGLMAERAVEAATSKQGDVDSRHSRQRPPAVSPAPATSIPPGLSSQRQAHVHALAPGAPARGGHEDARATPAAPDPGPTHPGAPVGPADDAPVAGSPSSPGAPGAGTGPSPGSSQGSTPLDPSVPNLPDTQVPDPQVPEPTVPGVPAPPNPTDVVPTVSEPTLPLPTVDVPEPTLPAPPTLP
jgi:RNA polymerase sigma factor (sigma-70 family)